MSSTPPCSSSSASLGNSFSGGAITCNSNYELSTTPSPSNTNSTQQSKLMTRDSLSITHLLARISYEVDEAVTSRVENFSSDPSQIPVMDPNLGTLVKSHGWLVHLRNWIMKIKMKFETLEERAEWDKIGA